MNFVYIYIYIYTYINISSKSIIGKNKEEEILKERVLKLVGEKKKKRQ